MRNNSHSRERLEEAVREVQIMAGLDMLPDREGATVIGVTSPSPKEGKTTLSMALASTLAQDYDTEVTLIDADFKTHSISEAYGFNGTGGLTEVLEGRSDLSAVIHRLPGTGLRVVAAGNSMGGAARISRSEQARALIAELRSESRFIVIDLPATLPSSLAPILARMCDTVVLVVRSGNTNRQDVERALRKLQDVPVAGVVLNRWRTRVPGWIERPLGLHR